MNIPLINSNSKQDINTSLIAIRNAINELSRMKESASVEDLQRQINIINQQIANFNSEFSAINTHLNTIDTNILNLQPVDTVASGNLHSVTSNAVANQTIQKINVSTQGADLEANIKAFLDEMSGKPTNPYNGLLNSSILNGNYSLTNFYNENTNWRSTIGIIEFDSNYGVYYVFRTSIGSDTPYYIVRRIDMPTISARNTATIVPSRFDSTYMAWCHWWRCGRIVTANIYASGVKCRLSANEPCFTGLPKPIIDSLPSNATNWGGTVNNWSMFINNDGEVIAQGGTSITDVIVHGLTSITYITRDD